MRNCPGVLMAHLSATSTPEPGIRISYRHGRDEEECLKYTPSRWSIHCISGSDITEDLYHRLKPGSIVETRSTISSQSLLSEGSLFRALEVVASTNSESDSGSFSSSRLHAA